MKNIFLTTIVLIFVIGPVDAQYFGRNKPRYENFDFQVVETPNFRIHHYLKNPNMVDYLSKVSEQWYTNHKQLFTHDITQKNPIIFYNSHADFQQTNTISGEIGIGTGGVTEALKNRVVMPIAFSLQSTHHVLVHELVHAFQFNNVLKVDSFTSLQSLGNTPLWMIEGMAEYFSISKHDPFTAMWMRDAILNDNLPEIQKMNNFKYFPYRYGHALMSFLGGFFGDDKLNPMFMNTARYGLDIGFQQTFGADVKTISGIWHGALKKHYAPVLDGKSENPRGGKILSADNSGRMNLSPSLSPDGKYVVFTSEKNLFSLDLFLADAETGNIIRKITSFGQSADLDYVNGLESSGAWSPDGKKIAYIGIRKGRNVLVIADIEKPSRAEVISVGNLEAFVNPVFHPGGREIVVTGLKEGQVDLFSINLKNKRATQLTNDIYSENLPSFSTDGNKLVFSYDKNSVVNGRPNGRYTYDIVEMQYPNGFVQPLNVFPGADNINPVYDHQGNIYFISDRDGMRNMYKYNSGDGKVFQMTDLLTGISGISGHSPAISASIKMDRVVYTHYYKSQYNIYEASSSQLLNKWIEDPLKIDQKMGTLPISGIGRKDIVDANFKKSDNDLFNVKDEFRRTPYKPDFKLDYVGGGGGVGVGVNNNNFSNMAGLQGGIDMLFGDLLGNHQLYSQAALNGEILDVGGIVSYLNRKNRFAWGVGVSHVPLRTGFQNFSLDELQDRDGNRFPVLKSTTNLIRIFDQSLSIFAHFPFSTTLRLEGGVAGTYRSFRWDEYNDFYFGDQFRGYELVLRERERIPTGDELPLDSYYTIQKGRGANANIALVGDRSFFGMTAPLAGHRFRLSLEHFIGNDQYSALLIDARKYFKVNAFTFAFRTTNYFRWEKETNSVYPNYVGNMGFVRGLSNNFSSNSCCPNIDFFQLLGSKMMLGGFEIRLPFTGPKGLGLIPTNFLLSDLNFFIDSGMAFDSFNEFTDGKELFVTKKDEFGNVILGPGGVPIRESQIFKPTLVTTAGVSLRLNLFGAFIIEPYFARPILMDVQNPQFKFGLNLIPGW